MTNKLEISPNLLDKILRLMGTTEGRRQIRAEVNAIVAQAEIWNPHPAEAHLASLLIVLGSAGIKVSGGTHGDPWTVAAPVVERQELEPGINSEFSWTPEINKFYEELSNGDVLSKRALCHIRHLKDGLSKHWKVVCDQRARIADLERGRGEPFTWMRLDVDGKPYCCRAEDHGDSFPVYREQPAPVVVVLPRDPEKAFIEWASELNAPPTQMQSYLAAIDKVKELNQ